MKTSGASGSRSCETRRFGWSLARPGKTDPPASHIGSLGSPACHQYRSPEGPLRPTLRTPDFGLTTRASPWSTSNKVTAGGDPPDASDELMFCSTRRGTNFLPTPRPGHPFRDDTPNGTLLLTSSRSTATPESAKCGQSRSRPKLGPTRSKFGRTRPALG